MRHLLAYCTVVLVVVTTACVGRCQDGVELSDPPDENDVSRLRDEVKDLYASYYRIARTDAGHRRLATELLEQAILERTDADLRFVMLTEAFEHAAMAGEGALALDAIRELRRTHDVSVAGLHTRVLEILDDRQESDGINRSLVNETARIIDRAVWDGDFEGAEELTAVASSVVTPLEDDALLFLIETRANALPAARELTDLARDHELGTATDADARLAAGKYLCFFTGSWLDGLPLLISGSDIELRELAQLDSAGTDNPIERATIADGWWDRIARELPFAGGRLKARAAYWYAPILSHLTGATSSQAEERFGEVRASFIFDGDGFIETPVTEFMPVILEAWVQPEPAQPRIRWTNNRERALAMFIASDIGGQYGFGLGLIDGKLHVMRIPGFHETSARVVSVRPSHVRVAFNHNQTNVYLNGRHVGEFPASQSRSVEKFTIGRARRDGGHRYLGRISQLRILRNQAPPTDFRPPLSLAATERTELLYDALAVDGENVLDLSRNGNDGLMHRVRIELNYSP